MSTIWDGISPHELTGYARAELERITAAQPLAAWLPNTGIPGIYYSFDTGGTSTIQTALYRAFDAEAPFANRAAGEQTNRGEIAPLALKLRLSEFEGHAAAELPDGVRAAAFRDVDTLMEGVAARLDIARGMAIATGRLDINENGMIASVDFGRNPAHSPTASVLWSDPAADVMGDLMSWVGTYVDNTGVRPGAIMMSMQMQSLLLKNDGLRAASGTLLPRTTVAAVNAALAELEIPPIQTNDSRYTFDTGSKRVLPADKVVMLPPANGPKVGATVFGTTAEARELQIEASEAPGVVAVAMKTFDPVQVTTKAAALAMPILGNADLTFAATVL